MSSKKKVFMLLTNPFKPDPRVYKEARTLIELGFDVTVVAWDREGSHKHFEVMEGIKVYRIPVISKYASFFDFLIKLPLFYIKAMLCVIRNRHGLYSIHANDFDTAPLAFFLSQILGVKFIFDIHDLYYTRLSLLKEQEEASVLVRILRTAEITFAKLSDSVITVSRSVGGRHRGFKEFLINHGVIPDKIYVVWNTPDLGLFPKLKSLRYKRNRGLIVGYIGNVRSVSNFIPLFEVAEKNKALKVLFVGGGASEDKIRKLLAERYPDINVEFVKHVPYQHIAEYYARCDVIYSVYPITENIKRTLAVKMFEGIVMGIPVIVNKDTLMADFVNLNRCGVAVKINPYEIAIAIEKSLKLKPPTKLRDKWNWERNKDAIKKAYGI